jgi:hypothetical protein
VQVVLSNIRTPELDEALLVLPFEFAIKLIHYLDRFISKGLIVELATHALLFLLKAHHVSETEEKQNKANKKKRHPASPMMLYLRSFPHKRFEMSFKRKELLIYLTRLFIPTPLSIVLSCCLVYLSCVVIFLFHFFLFIESNCI